MHLTLVRWKSKNKMFQAMACPPQCEWTRNFATANCCKCWFNSAKCRRVAFGKPEPQDVEQSSYSWTCHTREWGFYRLVLLVQGAFHCHQFSPHLLVWCCLFCVPLPTTRALSNYVTMPFSKPVVPNRGAAAPWGAICSAQGCRELTRFFTLSLKIHFQTVIKPQSKLLWVP